jgi:hypothetical protein
MDFKVLSSDRDFELRTELSRDDELIANLQVIGVDVINWCDGQTVRDIPKSDWGIAHGTFAIELVLVAYILGMVRNVTAGVSGVLERERCGLFTLAASVAHHSFIGGFGFGNGSVGSVGFGNGSVGSVGFGNGSVGLQTTEVAKVIHHVGLAGHCRSI